MGNIKFTLGKTRKRKWSLKKDVSITVIHPDKMTMKKTKKKIRDTKTNISKMNNTQKKDLLINKGILKAGSTAPDDIINTILDGLI